MTLNTLTAEISGQLPSTWVKAGEHTFSTFSFPSARILNTSTYDAFGVLIKTGADTVLYYYRQAVDHFGDDGILQRMEYTISTSTWGSPTTVYSHGSQGVSGLAGGVIDGKIMLFFSLTNLAGDFQSIGSILSTDGLTGATFDSRVTFTPGDVRYEAYGHLVHCGGQIYVQGWYSHNGAGTYKANLRRTTDNGATWTTINHQTSASPRPAEVDYEYLGEGRLIAIARNQANGYLLQSTSSDYGLTWTAFSATPMGNPSGVANSSMVYDAATETIYVCWMDRSAAKMMLAYARVSEVFGDPTKWIRQSRGVVTTAGNAIGGALGYPSMQLIASGDILCVWNDEVSSSDADIYGCRWTFTTASIDGAVAAIFPKGGTDPFGFTTVSASKPTLRAEAVYADSAIQFVAASSQYLSALQFPTTTAGTVFIVGKTSTLTDFPCLISSWDESGGAASGISFRANGNSANRCMEVADGTTNRVRGSTTITADTEYCWVFASSGAADGYDFRLGTNQETEVVRAGSNTGNWFGDFANVDNLTIGAEKLSSISQFFNGHIAEILIYPALLSSSDIDEVSTWLLTTTGTIAVSSPDAADRRIVGLQESVEWTSNNVAGTVDVLLSVDNGDNFTVLASAQSNTGLYLWTPTADHLGSQVVIRVRQTSDNAVYGDSQAFRLATTTPGSGGGSNTAERQFLRQIAQSILAVTE
jgi:hypothetical protein